MSGLFRACGEKDSSSMEVDSFKRFEVKGENEAKKIKTDGEFLTIEAEEGESCDKIFSDLKSIDPFEEAPLAVTIKSSTEILLPLSKQAVQRLHSCDYLSADVYLKLLFTVAGIEVAKSSTEPDYSATSSEGVERNFSLSRSGSEFES